MKLLDKTIWFLIILVIFSGGFVGYITWDLLIQKNQVEPITVAELKNTQKSDINSKVQGEDDVKIVSLEGKCIDYDGDGYGEGCEKGVDCDDKDIQRAEKCGKISKGIILTPDKNEVNIGDQIELYVKIGDIPAGEILSTLQFKLEFDPTLLQYQSYEVMDQKYDFNIPIIKYLQKGEFGIDSVMQSGKLVEGDQIYKIKFQAIASGTAEFQISENTRMGEIFEVSADEVEVVIN